MTLSRKSVFAFLLLIFVIVLIWLNWDTLNKPQYYELDNKELADIQRLRKSAYDYAMECSGIQSPDVPFDKLTWVLVPGSVLKINAIDGRITLKGFFNPADSVIYIPFTERSTYWILAHESLHAIGIRGHPSIPFELPCRLMADQNP